MFKVFTGELNPKTNKPSKHAIYINRPQNQVYAALGYYTEQSNNEFTCSILTTEALNFFDFHSRMPFTVDPQDKNYLFKTLSTENDYLDLIKQHKQVNDLIKYEVTHDVINSSKDSNNLNTLVPLNSTLFS